MDHLSYPSKPVYPPIKVPYVCRNGFEEILDRVGFEGYLRERRTSVGELSLNRHGSPVFQEWAYFGLLRACLILRNVRCRVTDFIRNDNGKRTLSSRTLRALIVEWVNKAPPSPHDVEQQKVKIRNYIDLVRGPLDRSLAALKSSDGRTATVTEQEAVIISVMVLIECCELALEDFKLGSGTDLKDIPHRDISASCEVFTRRLNVQGWCPTTVRLVSEAGHISAWYYLSAYPRPDVLDHQDCTSKACRHLQVDEQVYETQHAKNCPSNGCEEFISVDLERIVTLVTQGSIPVICLSGEHDNVDVAVHNADDVESYVAISHVWAHGMGNQNANSLPKCHLSWLRQSCSEVLQERVVRFSLFEPNKAASQLSKCSGTHIWIDTFCVPLRESVRKKAIQKMADVYRRATVTLVVDNLLTRSPLSSTEQLLHVALCDWNKRLWTLQEAILGEGKLYFKFADGVKSLQSLLHRFAERDVKVVNISLEDFTMSRTLLQLHLLGSVFSTIGYRAKSPEDFIEDAVQLLPLLLHIMALRSTSRPQDEVICMATVLALPTEDLLAVPPEDRMTRFYRAFAQNCPLELLFLSGERLEEEGFRWAPRQFLNEFSERDMALLRMAADRHLRPEDYRDVEPGIIGPEGLSIKLPTWHLKNFHPSLFQQIRRDGLRVNSPARFDSHPPALVSIDCEDWDWLAEVITGALEECELFVVWFNLYNFWPPVCSGVLIVATAFTAGRLEGRYVCPVWYSARSPSEGTGEVVGLQPTFEDKTICPLCID